MTRRKAVTSIRAAVTTLAFLACADSRPAVLGPSPRSPAPEPEANAPIPRPGEGSAVEASRPTPVEVSAPVADAGVSGSTGPASSSPAPVVAPRFIDLGPDPSRVQTCAQPARFTPLATLLTKPVPGRIMVRGNVWIPALVTCTASLPEHCLAAPVVALSRPSGQTQKQIVLIGNLTPGTTLDCTGRRGAMRCPIPIDGREYGVTGVVTEVLGSGYSEQWFLEVESLCRFSSEARR
ncbi:MAG: hypothetical protein K0S65_1776 [Labilithrix sp.]|nr:hypothetical protein [Labilithrix sp.]